MIPRERDYLAAISSLNTRFPRRVEKGGESQRKVARSPPLPPLRRKERHGSGRGGGEGTQRGGGRKNEPNTVTKLLHW